MAKRVGSLIRKSRSKRTKNYRTKGKLRFTAYFQSFKIGEKVCLKIDPGVNKGTFPPRFQGKIGAIKAQTGKNYIVVFKDGKKEKQLHVHPIHMRKL